MKKLFLLFWPMFFFLGSNSAFAQDRPDSLRKAEGEKSEVQEIIIRKKGDKDATIHLELSGDRIIINGKPLMEFNDSTVTVHKRKMVIGRQMLDERRLELEGRLKDMQERIEIVRGEPGGIFSSEKRALLGVSTKDIDNGVEIESVTAKSGAEAAGLKQGDIITYIDKEKVTDRITLTKIIRDHKPGDEVTVTYKRDGKEKKAKAKLTETVSLSEVRTYTYRMPEMGQSFRIPDINFDVPPMPNFDASPYGAKGKSLGISIQDTEDESGVKILSVAPGLAAEKAGLQKDDIIIEMNNAKIKNTDDARDQIKFNGMLKEYPVKVKRNGAVVTVTVKNEKKLKTLNL